MNPPPLPQPAAQTCPNCGAAAPEGARLCSNCGAALWVGQKDGCLVVLAQVVLALLGLGFGLGGACFVVLGGGGYSAGTGGIEFVMNGLGALTVAAACFYGVSQIGKGRR